MSGTIVDILCMYAAAFSRLQPTSASHFNLSFLVPKGSIGLAHNRYVQYQTHGTESTVNNKQTNIHEHPFEERKDLQSGVSVSRVCY